VSESVLERLAGRYADVRFADLPADVAMIAQHCVLDWFGCAVAGSQEPLTAILVRQLSREGTGPYPVIGHDVRLPARSAVLVNGAAGHALDYDDTHLGMMGHPTAPVLPALCALAPEVRATGDRLLGALVVGVEVGCRLGALLNPGHYGVGWHATGTLGTAGAAAACSHLLGLDQGRFTQALSLAATQAAGLKASFGTMAKPLHAGKAAADGLLAARLAAGGFTGNPAVVEAPQGWAAATGAAPVDGAALDDDRWLIRDVLFKWHAACYLTHAAMNAAAGLRERVDIAKVERVEIHVAPDLLSICGILEPATGLEAKFSVRATTAMALLGDDTAALSSYSDARMRSPELVSLRDRVELVPDVALPQTRARVVVATATETVEAEDDTSRPEGDLDRQWERLTAKFASLTVPVLGPDRAPELYDALTRIDELPSIDAVMQLTRQRSTQGQ
jgi:2-methylcitrate dehydratase PrpD